MLFATAKKRISIISIIICLILGVIGIKLTYLTIYRNNNLTSLAVKLWQRSFPLTAARGFILDCNDNKLTYNEPVVSVAAVPYQIKDKVTTAKLIAPVLDMDEEKLYEKFEKDY